MHSSRMRTGRSLTVCWSLLPGGGVCLGGVCSGGCLLWGVGGVCSQGVSALGGVCLLGGLSALGGCLLLGGLLPGGCLLPSSRGVSARGGGCIPACTEADTPPPREQNDRRVKILPWPQLRCGR